MANSTGTASGVGSPQGGQQAWDAAVNLHPIPPSRTGTLAAGTSGAGAAFTSLSTAFAKVVTNLVIRNLMASLRDKALILQEGAILRAKHVDGTNTMVYSIFADLGAADSLLEGVPPETATLAFDTLNLNGTQKGKVVAITDLAELFSPFELYSIAAEKVAWNALDQAERDVMAVINAWTPGITSAVVAGNPATSIVNAVTALKNGDVPMFPDGTYHAFINPTASAKVMTQVGELGWTDAYKYANQGEGLLNGEIGKFRGVRFIETTRATSTKTVIFGPEAFVFGDFQSISAYRVAPGGDHADPLAQRGLVGWKGMYGAAVASFTGTPAVGPATNTKGERALYVDLTT